MTRALNTAVELFPSDSNTQAYDPGEIFAVMCTVAGNVSVDLSSGRELSFRVEVGQSFIPIAVSRLNATGTTATARYYNVRQG